MSSFSQICRTAGELVVRLFQEVQIDDNSEPEDGIDDRNNISLPEKLKLAIEFSLKTATPQQNLQTLKKDLIFHKNN